jgi:Mg2+/citrate symporter
LVAYFLIACFVVAFFILPNAIARTGACLCVLACAYLAHQLHKRREQAVSEQTTAITSIRAYRAELERQRDFHCGKWFWSRWLIFLPSYLIFIAGFASAHPELARMLWVIGAVTVASAIVAVPVQYKEAQWYQKRIDQLDALER